MSSLSTAAAQRPLFRGEDNGGGGKPSVASGGVGAAGGGIGRKLSEGRIFPSIFDSNRVSLSPTERGVSVTQSAVPRKVQGLDMQKGSGGASKMESRNTGDYSMSRSASGQIPSQPLSHRQILAVCCTLLDGFNVNATTSEEYVDDFFARKGCPVSDPSDRALVDQIFGGCARHSKILNAAVAGFYSSTGETCLRSERSLYVTLLYLAIFRLDDLGFPHFKKFVKSQDPYRMHRLLAYIFDAKRLERELRDEWSRLYDASYVQANLVQPIMRAIPAATDLISKLEEVLNNGTVGIPSRPAQATTEPKPFKLTRPRPRLIPEPVAIPTMPKARDVPQTTYAGGFEREDLARQKDDNRRKAEELLRESNRRPFECARRTVSEKTKLVRLEIENERLAQLQFDKPKALPLPPPAENAPIKLNTAAILREEVVFRRKEELEARKLAMLESGAQDTSAFEKWQEEQRKQQLARDIEEIERRHLEGLLSYEEAIAARQAVAKGNREVVVAMQSEAERMLDEARKQRELEEEENRRLVELTNQMHLNAVEAKIKVQESKQKIVMEVTRDLEQMKLQAEAEEAAEREKRAELIRQIRALESVPLSKTKFVDLSETSGLGLLSEMSVLELRERIALLKMRIEQDEEAKRKEILQGKQQKEQSLMAKLDKISRHRAEEGRQAAIRNELKKVSTKDELKDKRILELQRKVEQKRTERFRDREKTQQKPQPYRVRSRDFDSAYMEELRYQEMEDSQQRAAKNRMRLTPEMPRLSHTLALTTRDYGAGESPPIGRKHDLIAMAHR
eukprot:Opistho-2@86463